MKGKHTATANSSQQAARGNLKINGSCLPLVFAVCFRTDT
jgi:hypothetical protein